MDAMLFNYLTNQLAWAEQDPSDPARSATLGMVYSANGLWAEANLAFSNTVRLSPKEPLAWLYWGVSFQEIGQPDRAIGVIQDLTKRFPGFAPGFARLGEYLLRVGRVDEAEPAFARLTGLAPQEWRGYSGLGECKLRKGDPAGAAKLFEQSVQTEASAKPPHALLGQAYQQLGRPEDARREFELGMNAQSYPMPDAWSLQAPKYMRLLVDLIEIAQTDIKSGQASNAIPLLRQALPYHPNNPTLLITLGQAYTAAGDPQKAAPILKQALSIETNSVPAYIALSACELGLGHLDEALSNADHAVSLGTNQIEAYVARANALLGMQRDNEAVAALRDAYRGNTNNAQLLLDMGDICLRNLHRPDEALAAYRQAASINPQLLPAHLRLFSLYLRSGDKAAARQSLETARQLAPKDPEIAAALARLNSSAP
jgi:tetratricopeptide (TPR) repeat protein